MNKTKLLVYWILFSGMLVMNYLSALNVGNVADNNQAIIQPAGWAFSIWSIIYLLLFIWLIRLTIMLVKGENGLEDIGYWPALNFILNGLWIYIFSEQSKLLSNFVIIGLLLTLVIIYRQLQMRPFDKLVFSIYFSWVSVATIVNIFTWVKSLNVTTVLGLNELTWTIVMLIIGSLLSVYIAMKYRDFVYPLIFVYAYTAIWAENGWQFDGLGITIISAIVIELFSALFILFKKGGN